VASPQRKSGVVERGALAQGTRCLPPPCRLRRRVTQVTIDRRPYIGNGKTVTAASLVGLAASYQRKLGPRPRSFCHAVSACSRLSVSPPLVVTVTVDPFGAVTGGMGALSMPDPLTETDAFCTPSTSRLSVVLPLLRAQTPRCVILQAAGIFGYTIACLPLTASAQ
jgi:hypothetical protein